jgi:high-affinity iron transporter
MFAAAVIVFREVLEAALIISIVMAATRGTPRRGRFVLAGLGAGLLGACIVAALAGEIADSAQGMGQELLNAAILGAAVLMLGWHNVWMSRHGRQMAHELKEVGRRAAAGSVTLWAVAVAVGLAVLREGAEVVLFLFGIASGGAQPLPMLLGSLAGVGAGAAVGVLMYRGLLRIPMRHFFTATGLLLLFLTAGLAAQSAGFLVQAGVLPALADPLWDTSRLIADESLPGQLLKALIGYSSHPTGIQVVVYFATLLIVWGLMRTVGTAGSPPARVATTALVVLAAAAAFAGNDPAQAAPFKVYSPNVVQGEGEVEYRGYRDFDNNKEIDGGETHLFGIGYAFTDWYSTEVYGEWAKEPDESQRKFSAWEWENRFQLGESGQFFADFGLLFEIEKADGKELYELKLAPIIEKQFGNFVATANLWFERQVGSARESTDVTFAYGARVRYLLSPYFEPAVEFFGEPGPIGKWPGYSQQQHWIGPAVYGAVPTLPRQKLKYSFAVLFGTTTESSDVRAVARLEYEFY